MSFCLISMRTSSLIWKKSSLFIFTLFFLVVNLWIGVQYDHPDVRLLQQATDALYSSESNLPLESLCGTRAPSYEEIVQAVGVERKFREARGYYESDGMFETEGNNGSDEESSAWGWIQSLFQILSRSGERASSKSNNGGRWDFWNGGSSPTPVDEKVTIPVYYHVLQPTSIPNSGDIADDDRVQSQHVHLNLSFASTGFSFSLEGITRTVNREWYFDEDTLSMKKALHVGGKGTLNVYINKPTSGNLGYATFPSQFSPFLAHDDGIVLLDASLPGASRNHYNQGTILVHEVGHWLGLYHTFQNDCQEPGDGIDDTPFHQVNLGECPTDNPNTCPDLPGLDPIHNFMNYLHNACLTSFTKGQIIRMKSQWAAYRS